MNEEGLRFDPTILTSGGKQYIEIERNSKIERLIIDEVIMQAYCIASRATTCWKAYCNKDLQILLIIKDL